MIHAGFFERTGPFPLWLIAEKVGAQLGDAHDGASLIVDVRPLREATSHHLAFFENRKYASQLATTKAGACILAPAEVPRMPNGTAALTTPLPYEAFARAMSLFYPDALRSKAANAAADRSGSLIHPSAQIGEGAVIEPVLLSEERP